MGLSGRTIANRGERGGAYVPGIAGAKRSSRLSRPASLAGDGPVGPYHRGEGEDLGGASGHAPSVNSPLGGAMGWSVLTNAERGRTGPGIWTRPLSAGEPLKLIVGSPCGEQWAYRTAPSRTKGGRRGVRPRAKHWEGSRSWCLCDPA